MKLLCQSERVHIQRIQELATHLSKLSVAQEP